MAIYRSAATAVRMGDLSDTITSGLTSIGTRLVDDLTGKGGSSSSSSTTHPPLASSSSPWPWIAGLAGGAVVLTLLLRR